MNSKQAADTFKIVSCSPTDTSPRDLCIMTLATDIFRCLKLLSAGIAPPHSSNNGIVNKAKRLDNALDFKNNAVVRRMRGV